MNYELRIVNCIKELILKAPDGREKRMLAFLPTEDTERNFLASAMRMGLEVSEIKITNQ